MDEQKEAGGEYGRTEGPWRGRVDGGGKGWKRDIKEVWDAQLKVKRGGWSQNRRKIWNTRFKLHMNESFSWYKTSSSCRPLSSSFPRQSPASRPSYILSIWGSVLCGLKRVVGDRICLSGLWRAEDFISSWQPKKKKRGGGSPVRGINRPWENDGEQKEEEEVVMVKMCGTLEAVWDRNDEKKGRKLETRDFADGFYRNMLVNSSRRAKTWRLHQCRLKYEKLR